MGLQITSRICYSAPRISLLSTEKQALGALSAAEKQALYGLILPSN